MKIFIPLFVIFAMLFQAMLPIVVVFHNSGKQPQEYNLPPAIGATIFTWFVILYLFALI